MTVLGWILEKIDPHISRSVYTNYQAFRGSYDNSAHQSRASSFQTYLWILALVTLNVPPLFLNEYVGIGQTLFVVIAFLALLIPSIVQVWHWRSERPFNYQFSWYPITTRPQPLRESHSDKLLLNNQKDLLMIVYCDVLGQIEGYDFRLVSSHEDLTFDLYPELGMAQESYPDDRGLYSKQKVENDFTFNIFTVQKQVPFRGDPTHTLKIIDVSDIGGRDYGDEISDEVAERQGKTILEIQVVE